MSDISDVQQYGSRPAGSELEIYLGFPACFRAELWRSDEPDLTMQLLASAPFISPPESMTVLVYYTSVAAACVNLLFAAAVLTIVWVVAAEPRRQGRTMISLAAGCAAIAIVCYLVADRVSTHL